MFNKKKVIIIGIAVVAIVALVLFVMQFIEINPENQISEEYTPQQEISEEDLQRLKGFDITKLANIGARFFIEPTEQEQATSSEQQEDTQNTIIAQ